MLSRREVVAGLCAATFTSACRGRDRDVLRVGVMTNLTHAPALVGLASGRIERTLGIRVEIKTFRAGPRVAEALVGDAIDIGVAGPAAIVYTHARHGAGVLRILTGCASGGASFVVRPDSAIRGPDDLRGKILATPQIGTTQDIALRKYLHLHGYDAAERGGTVTVHALDPSTILTEMRQGRLDGAWLPEPWATRVVEGGPAVRLIDERDLWPGKKFPTALVTARGDFVRNEPALAAAFTRAMVVEVNRALAGPDATCEETQKELARLLGKPLPLQLLRHAWPWVDFTSDPLADALETLGRDATALGLAPPMVCRTLFGSELAQASAVNGM